MKGPAAAGPFNPKGMGDPLIDDGAIPAAASKTGMKVA
jgi:hypothetical protein